MKSLSKICVFHFARVTNVLLFLVLPLTLANLPVFVICNGARRKKHKLAQVCSITPVSKKK